MIAHRKKIFVLCSIIVLCTLVVWYVVWNPGYSRPNTCFDTGQNGLWVGHQWYTGYNVRTGLPVSHSERDSLLTLLNANRIRYVYIHAGPITDSGTIQDNPGSLCFQLQSLTPNIMYLPWLGGLTSRLDITNPEWHRSFITTLEQLHDAGFRGVHLDIEPINDHQPGYIDLLKNIRSHFGDSFFISHATRRIAPMGKPLGRMKKHFWSSEFYYQTMHHADQTVLMGYDTCIKLKKIYTAYIRHQTRLLLRLANRIPNHQLLIGIPSYEDVPKLSDPHVENIPNAVMGVRGALAQDVSEISSFQGVAIYAHWVTDAMEWKQYRAYWLNRP